MDRVWGHTPVMTALRECRQVDQKFKVLVSYIVNSRPSWVIDPVGGKKEKIGKSRWEKKRGVEAGSKVWRGLSGVTDGTGYREVCHPWLGFSVLQGENSSPKPDMVVVAQHYGYT